jgi:hypothetical protein
MSIQHVGVWRIAIDNHDPKGGVSISPLRFRLLVSDLNPNNPGEKPALSHGTAENDGVSALNRRIDIPSGCD